MKRIVTIQHTQSVHHNNGMVGSWTDWALTDYGKAQAECIGRKLAAELAGKDYKIYASDLMRARQTAGPLSGYMGIEVEYRPKLREHNLGEAVGKSGQWAKENALPVNSFDDRAFPGAESWREFWDRISGLCQDIIADEAERIILVSHGVTLSVWQQVWLGSAIAEFKYSGLPGGVSFMCIDDDGRRVLERLNDASYAAE